MEKNYRELYEKITNSDWFKNAYHNKSLGECPIVVEELEESEDEKARKWLIEELRIHYDFESPDLNPMVKKALAYLEKQKYDRMQPIYDSIDSFESALDKAWKAYNNSGARTVDGCEDNYVECAHAKGFREGYLFGLEKQKVRKPVECIEFDNEFENQVSHLIASVLNGEHEYNEGFVKYVAQSLLGYAQKEQKPYVFRPHAGDVYNPYDMSFEEAQSYIFSRGFDIPWNDGDIYIDERYLSQTFGNILRWADEHPKEQKPAEWSEEDKVMLNMIEYRLKDWDNIKAQQGYQDNYASQSPVKWIESLPERFNLQWSEEDAEILNSIIVFVSGYADKRVVGRWVKFLKSLRPQPKQELSIEKAIQWLKDTFFFQNNSSGRGEDYEITTYDFDSMEEMYESFRKSVIVESQPH